MTRRAQLSERAEQLRALHAAPELLLLPNAWDAASARLIVDELGFPAVATTSHGMAEALGHQDEEATPPEQMFAAVGRIAAAVSVPVTADLESGYLLDGESLVEALLNAGAVGLNIEDTNHRTNRIVAVDAHAHRLADIKAAGRAAGVGVVLNARVDEFIHGDRDMDTALARARAYAEAGADSVYPIGLADEDAIKRFVTEAGTYVNVLMRPGAPPLSRLEELGVARVSWGGFVYKAAMEAVREFVNRATGR